MFMLNGKSMRSFVLAAVVVAVLAVVISAQPPTPAPPGVSVATTDIPATMVTTTAAPVSGTGVPSTPIPTTASAGDVDALFDVVFSLFIEEVDERGNILKVLESASNVSAGRVVYYEQSNEKKGFLFGKNVIVRFKVLPASKASPKLADDVRSSLILLAETKDPRLTNIDLVEIIAVPADFSVYRFQTRTKWDLLYTLVMVAGGLLFIAFVAWIIFKIVVCVRRKSEDAKLAKEAKEEELAKKRRQEGGAAAAGPSSTVAAVMEGEDSRALSSLDEPDEEEMALVQELQQFKERSMLHVPSVATATAISERAAHRTRKLMEEFELPPEVSEESQSRPLSAPPPPAPPPPEGLSLEFQRQMKNMELPPDQPSPHRPLHLGHEDDDL